MTNTTLEAVKIYKLLFPVGQANVLRGIDAWIDITPLINEWIVKEKYIRILLNSEGKIKKNKEI
jgi:hypothetical protein